MPQVRPALTGLQPYEPGKPSSEVRRELGLDRVVKLSSNEGPLGPFPSALEAIARASPGLNRYPELDYELIERLAALHGVDRSWVSLGHGADSIVWHLSVAYLDPGDEAVMCWPSFPSYHLDAIKCAATPVHVALRDGAYDLEALAERITERTRIAYVCNPNNPTGGIIDAAALERFLDAVPERVVVVVDEAYHEYVDAPGYPDTIAAHVRGRPNVVVLRTFSKIYGLAGLRVGYAVAPAADQPRPRPRPTAVRGQPAGTRGGDGEPGRRRRDRSPARSQCGGARGDYGRVFAARADAASRIREFRLRPCRRRTGGGHSTFERGRGRAPTRSVRRRRVDQGHSGYR